MAPKFSIITVTYNSEAYISRCIDSVLSQDYSDFEYILVDGCSTDTTLNIVANQDLKRGEYRLSGHQSMLLKRFED